MIEMVVSCHMVRQARIVAPGLTRGQRALPQYPRGFEGAAQLWMDASGPSRSNYAAGRTGKLQLGTRPRLVGHRRTHSVRLPQSGIAAYRHNSKPSDNLGGAFLVDSGYAVPDTSEHTQPAVAFDGTNYLVVWTTSSGIWGTRVDSTGRVIDRFGFVIGTINPGPPQVTFGTTCFLVVWRGFGGVDAVRVRRDGYVLDPNPIYVGVPILAGAIPSVAFGGSSFQDCVARLSLATAHVLLRSGWGCHLRGWCSHEQSHSPWL